MTIGRRGLSKCPTAEAYLLERTACFQTFQGRSSVLAFAAAVRRPFSSLGNSTGLELHVSTCSQVGFLPSVCRSARGRGAGHPSRRHQPGAFEHGVEPFL